jgi:sugar/nucleoside kinase (ribokinase family)
VEPFASLICAEAGAAGIDVDRCAAAPQGSDPQITVALVADRERAFLTRAPGRALPELVALRGARHLHIGELRTLREHSGLIGLARASGMSVSLDCGWDDSVTADVAALVAAVDVFLPNEGEAVHLQQLGLRSPLAPLTIVKRGAGGATAIWSEGRIEAPGHSVDVVDTTGAGDAFNAGFLDRWLDGAELADCLAAGNACGAATVQAVGGVGGGPAIRRFESSARMGEAG